MGADEARAASDPSLSQADSQTYARVLSRLIRTMDYDLILCGKEAIDDGASQVPTRLARILDLPVVNFVSQLKIANEVVQATRDIDGGKEMVEVSLPCVLTAQKGLNEPRYPSLRHILLAKKKGIQRFTLTKLGLSPGDIAPRVQVKEYVTVPPRQGGNVLTGQVRELVSEVVRIIREEVKVL